MNPQKIYARIHTDLSSKGVPREQYHEELVSRMREYEKHYNDIIGSARTTELPANFIETLRFKTFKSPKGVERTLDVLRAKGYSLPPGKIAKSDDGWRWQPMDGQFNPLRSETGAINVSDIVGAFQRFREKMQPFSTTPEGKSYLLHRGLAKGEAAIGREFAEDVHKELKALSEESRTKIFRFLDGRVDARNLTPDEATIGSVLQGLEKEI
jgi:hypothetical protein